MHKSAVQVEGERDKVAQRRAAEEAAKAAHQDKLDEIKRKLDENMDVRAAHLDALERLKVRLVGT